MLFDPDSPHPHTTATLETLIAMVASIPHEPPPEE
jgi:hypothetical protein